MANSAMKKLEEAEAQADAPKPVKPKSGGGRPQVYKLAGGQRVPSVTTILGKCKDPGGLVHWAWSLGIEGKDYRQVRDDAAEAGAIAHDWIEDLIHGRELRSFPDTDPETMAKAKRALEAFTEWRDQVRLEVLETEVALVSEKYRYGGTFDALAKVAGRLVLLDWKSSNAVYGEYIAQVGGYYQLLRERGTEVQGAQLLRFGKEHGDFHAHSYPLHIVEMGWRFFEHARAIYDLHAALKSVAA